MFIVYATAVKLMTPSETTCTAALNCARIVIVAVVVIVVVVTSLFRFRIETK